MKPAKCKACKEEYQKWTTTQKACSPKCAIELVQAARANERRKDTSKRKQALKTLSDWLREAQTACNAYIRERDRGLPCISCGNTRDVKYCAGHYKTRGGHPELRFHPFNINRQCDWNCNLNLSGNIEKYRVGLINKIGQANVDWLEGPHQAQNLTIDDAKEIKTYYKEQLKLLKQGEV